MHKFIFCLALFKNYSLFTACLHTTNMFTYNCRTIWFVQKRHNDYFFLYNRIISYSLDLFEAFTIKWLIQITHFSFVEFVHYLYGYIFKKTQKPFKCNNCANAYFYPRLCYFWFFNWNASIWRKLGHLLLELYSQFIYIFEQIQI